MKIETFYLWIKILSILWVLFTVIAASLFYYYGVIKPVRKEQKEKYEYLDEFRFFDN